MYSFARVRTAAILSDSVPANNGPRNENNSIAYSRGFVVMFIAVVFSKFRAIDCTSPAGSEA